MLVSRPRRIVHRFADFEVLAPAPLAEQPFVRRPAVVANLVLGSNYPACSMSQRTTGWSTGVSPLIRL
eukprot:7777348-Alexandrium_andersonii.AAC.1